MTENKDLLEKQYCCHELTVFALPCADCTLQNFHIHTGTAPLRLDRTLAENGVQHQQTLHCHPRLLGGAGGRPLAPAYPLQQQPIRFEPVSDRAAAKQAIVQLMRATGTTTSGGFYLAIWQVAADTPHEALELRDAIVKVLNTLPNLSGLCTPGPIQNR
jgi:hypothetical protein